MKIRDVLKKFREDVWYLDSMNGSHRQFEHAVKPGKVTVNGKPGDDISFDNLNSIERQAGLKF